MIGVDEKRKMDEMRSCLKQCDKFIDMFGDFNIVNFPKILATVKEANKEMNLKKLFADIKRLSQ